MGKKLQAARGTVDIFGKEARCWQQIEDVFKEFCYLYNYQEMKTPIFEDTAVFKRENDSSDVVNKEMYTFSINNKDSLTLRPEGTAGVVRSYVQHKLFANGELSNKFYYFGPMFRYERPQKGRQRQFYQFGIENFSEKSPYVDAEVLAFGYSILKALGLSQIKVLINTLGDAQSRENYRQALKEYFEPYLPELCGDCQRRYEQNVLRLLDCKVDHEHECMKNPPRIEDSLTPESKAYFLEVKNALDALGIPYEVDQRLVRGLDYYTDTVFEVVSTNPESGAQSTVFGGGRYDNLVEYFDGPSQSGIGFAMGMERLMILCEAEGVFDSDADAMDAYVISLGNVKQEALQVASMLRANGYRCEVNYANRSMKSQFKSCERLNAKYIVILGEDEVKNHSVNVKNTQINEQVNVDIDALVQKIDAWEGVESHHHE